MTLNQEDKDKINYKPDINWYKERMYRISEEEKPLDKLYVPEVKKIDPEVLLENYRDLDRKAKKLDSVIDKLSMALSIPIDKEKQPRISAAINQMDPSSKGEYLTYTLYRDLLLQIEAGRSNIDLDFILNNQTYDIYADSNLIYNQYIEGAKNYTAVTPIGTGSTEATDENKASNAMLDNISSYNTHEAASSQIIEFTRTYLSQTDDQEYIPWNFKEDVRRKITEYVDVDNLLVQYTPMVADLVVEVEPFPVTPLELSTDLGENLENKRDNDNNFFNKTNAIFAISYGSDLLCCFVAWSGGLDKKTLSALKIAIQLMSNNIKIDFSNLLGTFMNIISSLFKNIIGIVVIALVDKIFQMVTDPIRRWLNSDDEKWSKLFECTAINDLINTYVIGGIDSLEVWLTGLILDFGKRIEIDKFFEGKKLDLSEKKKWLSDLSKLLDMVINAVGKSALCGQENSPTGDEISRLIEAYGVGPLFDYDYPEEESPNKYNSFVKEQIVVEKFIDETTGEENLREKTVIRFDTGTKTADLSQDSLNIDKCLKRVSEGDIFSVQEWMTEIRSRSQEGS